MLKAFTGGHVRGGRLLSSPTNLASRVFTERKDYGLKPTQRRQGYF